MSNFAVTVQRVLVVRSHDNADRLAIAELDGIGYQFVVGNGAFTPGDYVVYFPLDSVIPNELATTLGLPTKEGKPFRVKSIRLRGQWSEGVLAPLSITGLKMSQIVRGMDLTERLGVTKYEPPEPEFNIFGSGRSPHLRALPTTVRRYDIENLQRYPAIYEALKDVVVVVTEKMEGSHFWCRIDKDGETIHVGQRNFEIARGEETDPLHPFWKALYTNHLDNALRSLALEYRGYDITIRGEIVGQGIQGNYYDTATHHVYAFEIELNGEPVGAYDFLTLCADHDIQRVPVLAHVNTLGELAPTLEDAIALAHGQSRFIPKLREGIVIKPKTEMYHPEIGRLFIKIRDAAYLAQ